jgi:RNA polymerase subunit RPABC4/transcription elongation factor Spt4
MTKNPFDFSDDNGYSSSTPPHAGGTKRDTKNPELWRFGLVFGAVVTTAIVLAIGLGVLGELNPKAKETPTPWAGFAIIVGLFTVASAAATCVVPLAMGHLWRDESALLGKWGEREFRMYIPRDAPGWIGYYFAIGLAASCIILIALALIFIFAIAVSTKPCRYCRAEIPMLSSVCPNCGFSSP